MPKFKFVCQNCGDAVLRYVNASTESIQCVSCNKEMKRQIPTTGSQAVKEVIDPYTGVTHLQDQQELLKERKEDHYWNVEVPRLIQTYSIETCLEQKWLVFNDKGELVINKPPKKR
jgi:hypothetical protein